MEAMKLKYLVLIYQNNLVGALKQRFHKRGVPAEPAFAQSAEKLMALGSGVEKCSWGGWGEGFQGIYSNRRPHRDSPGSWA